MSPARTDALRDRCWASPQDVRLIGTDSHPVAPRRGLAGCTTAGSALGRVEPRRTHDTQMLLGGSVGQWFEPSIAHPHNRRSKAGFRIPNQPRAIYVPEWLGTRGQHNGPPRPGAHDILGAFVGSGGQADRGGDDLVGIEALCSSLSDFYWFASKRTARCLELRSPRQPKYGPPCTHASPPRSP